LPLEVYTRGSCGSDPVAVVHGRGSRQQILIASAAARAAGVRPGISTAAACALVTNLQLHPRNEAAEDAALRRLAAWCGQYTSLVSLDPPRDLLLEVAGSLKLFGGLARLCDQVRNGLVALGYHVVLAAAPTPLAATWLARAQREYLVRTPDRLVTALADLPVSVLGTGSVSASLRGMGVDSLGDCLRLPRDGLARRFSPQLVNILDRALGRLPDPRLPYQPPRRFHARLVLPAPAVDSESLLFALNRLLQELVGRLSACNAAVRRLLVTFAHERRQVSHLTVESLSASRDPQWWQRLLRERMAGYAMSGPVLEVVLRAGRFEALAGCSLELLPIPGRAREQCDELVTRLRARLGHDAVRGLARAAEHRPELAWRYCAPGEAGTDCPPLRRPLWLLARPLPLRCHDGRPQLDGTLILLPDAERIESGWWDGADQRREYYVARHLCGPRLWVYREAGSAQRWFLHGIFD